MSLKKFGPRDIITNTMRTHPSCEFFIVEGNIYHNNTPHVSGAITGSLLAMPTGHTSLYELNVDRMSGSTGRFIGGSSETNEKVTYDLTTNWVAGEGAIPGGSTTQYEYTSTSAGNLQAWWPAFWFTSLSVTQGCKELCEQFSEILDEDLKFTPSFG